MESKLEELARAAEVATDVAGTMAAVDAIRWRYLGKKGELTALLRSLGSVPEAERPRLGALANEVRERLTAELERRRGELLKVQQELEFASDAYDVTLPGIPLRLGCKHPLTQAWEGLEDIFIAMGFSVVEGPEVEWDRYNFELLNLPKGHPARDMQDSFYITDEILLRTHTSPVQLRTMERMAPKLPVRIVAPGRVYRRDDDPTHTPMFHQLECLAVDVGLSLGDLKGTLLQFARAWFGPQTTVRLRPSYFPFTEPSCEVDVTCSMCRGAGCGVCKGTGWLEILGAGMVHPQVLRNGGYDPEKVSGFAFGLGIDRAAMLKFGFGDLRLLFNNDVRFLEQF
ncbi:MAG: phenylalanine--tRNA ligase subunit alpha [Bacillota bacterium]